MNLRNIASVFLASGVELGVDSPKADVTFIMIGTLLAIVDL